MRTAEIDLTTLEDEAFSEETARLLREMHSFMYGYAEVTSREVSDQTLDKLTNTRKVTQEVRATLEDGSEAVIETTETLYGHGNPSITSQRVESYRTTPSGEKTDHVVLQDTDGKAGPKYESHPPIPNTGRVRGPYRSDTLNMIYTNMNKIKSKLDTQARKLGKDNGQIRQAYRTGPYPY